MNKKEVLKEIEAHDLNVGHADLLRVLKVGREQTLQLLAEPLVEHAVHVLFVQRARP